MDDHNCHRVVVEAAVLQEMALELSALRGELEAFEVDLRRELADALESPEEEAPLDFPAEDGNGWRLWATFGPLTTAGAASLAAPHVACLVVHHLSAPVSPFW